MRELGRLRELAFRRVGEGTGARRDLDRFDGHYRHLVLWDENALAIVGAYRLGEARTILAERGTEGLYSSTLFDYADPPPAFHQFAGWTGDTSILDDPSAASTTATMPASNVRRK